MRLDDDDDEKRLSYAGSNYDARTKIPDDDSTSQNSDDCEPRRKYRHPTDRVRVREFAFRTYKGTLNN
jgi:hypothetical protein